MRTASLCAMALSATSILWGDIVPSGSINGTAATCAGYEIFGPQSTVMGMASNSVDAPECVVPPPDGGYWLASANARVDLTGSNRIPRGSLYSRERLRQPLPMTCSLPS